MLETRHSITVVTKSTLVERDLDLLRELAPARLGASSRKQPGTPMPPA